VGGVETNPNRSCTPRSPRAAGRESSEEGGMKTLLAATLIGLSRNLADDGATKD
jgi:hypothetical protein